MYDVMVYDERIGQYVPLKNGSARVGYETWAEAAGAAHQYTLRDPSRMYTVEYRSVRRRKKVRR